MLFAQIPDVTFTQIADYVFQKGPAAGLTMLIVWLLWKYGPALAESHLNLVQTLSTCTKQNTDDISEIKESVVVVKKNSKILSCFAEAGKAAFPDHPEVRRHLDRAIDEHARN